jgi:hypothetical protein
MKFSLRRFAGAVCLALCASSGFAGELADGWSPSNCETGSCATGCCDVGCDSSCVPCEDGAWGGFAEAELMFLRYHRADGVRMGSDAGEWGEFNFEPAGRYTLGVVGPSGMGFRGRYFRYNHFLGIENAGDGLGVETFSVDVEGFDVIELSDLIAVEVSAGARYNEFRESMIDVGEADSRLVQFNGMGLVAALEARRLLGAGHLYARARGAVVHGDKDIRNVDGGFLNQDFRLLDVNHGMIEISWGYESNYQMDNGMTLFARTGVEWQNWVNFSNEFDGVLGEPFFDGPTDVGLAGFTLSGGVSY